jgi:hypothetical protein
MAAVARETSSVNSLDRSLEVGNNMVVLLGVTLVVVVRDSLLDSWLVAC